MALKEPSAVWKNVSDPRVLRREIARLEQELKRERAKRLVLEQQKED